MSRLLCSAIPMRIVIGLLVAGVVLLVAVVTLVITYSVALSSLRDLAEDYSISLVNAASLRTSNFIATPIAHGELVRRRCLKPGHRFPSEDPDPFWYRRYDTLFQDLFILANLSYVSGGIVFDDGSALSSDWIDLSTRGKDWLFQWASSMRGVPAGNASARGPQATTQIFFSNMSEPEYYYKPNGTVAQGGGRGDSRFAGYEAAKTFFPGKEGFLAPLSLWHPFETDVFFTLGVGANLYNSSDHFLGMALLVFDLPSTVTQFLHSVKATPDTEVFALDSTGFLVASTYSGSSFYTLETTSNANAFVGPGCSSTADASINAQNVYYIGCRKRPSQLGYAPLAATPLSMLTTQGQVVSIVDPKDGSGSYYVVSARVNMGLRGFAMNIIFIMPEEVIVGGIIRGRNTAIGATVGVFVLACIASFLLVFFLLQPLNDISRRMHDTARLRGDDDNDDGSSGAEEPQFSNLTEVRNLQKSYYNMNAAIQSFTKYVPKDVVTDLMQTGQLCAINMSQMKCTSLFTDIQGFTTVCERVPVDQLSTLVSRYFEVMSKIVMRHDGLIDKYIGDCIMAVWGAPFPLPNQEAKATLAGLLLNRETLVDPLASAFDEAGEVLAIRVGINTGLVLAGNMGSSQRMNYTVIGDPVNLAARLESLNKQFGTRVMISEDTQVCLGNLFTLRLLMSIAVVGKSVPVQVYEVVGVNPNLTADDREALQTADRDYENGHRQGGATGNGLGTEDDDQTSIASSIHTAGGGVVSSGRKLHQAVALFHEAMTTPSDFPIVPLEEEVNFAQQYTEAVKLYEAKRFTLARQKLELMREKFPAYILGGLKKGKSSSSVFSPYSTTSGDNNGLVATGLHVVSEALDTAAGTLSKVTGNTTEDKYQQQQSEQNSNEDHVHQQEMQQEQNGSGTNSGRAPTGRERLNNTTAEKSMELLIRLCEKYEQDPSEFTGYYTADEK